MKKYYDLLSNKKLSTKNSQPYVFYIYSARGQGVLGIYESQQMLCTSTVYSICYLYADPFNIKVN